MMSDYLEKDDELRSDTGLKSIEDWEADSAPDQQKLFAKSNKKNGSRQRGNFFAVDRHLWKMACGLGIKAAIAYLLAARGTAADLRTTSWSAEAMRVRTALSWHACNQAFQTLVNAGLLKRVNEPGKRPRYILSAPHEVAGFISPAPTKINSHADSEGPFSSEINSGDGIEKDQDWIFLPNALVDNLGSSKMPIELLRQSGNLIALRLLIDLYDAQSLAEFSGVDWRHVRQEYEGSQIGERGAHVVWGFVPGTMKISPDAPFIRPYLSGDPKQISGMEIEPDVDLFRAAFELLFDVGLIERVAHVIDSASSDGALVHPYAVGNGEEWERELAFAAQKAGLAMLSRQKRDEAIAQRLHLLPMKKHYQDVQIFGILRTKFRAKTRNTGHWLSEQYADWLTFHKANEAEACKPPLRGNRHQR